jgi:hypothetical protein
MTKEKPDKRDENEPHPDAWNRFERAVDQVIKSPPQHKRNAVPSKRVHKTPTRSKAKVQKIKGF